MASVAYQSDEDIRRRDTMGGEEIGNKPSTMPRPDLNMGTMDIS
jgi:hypothetical protein